MPHSMQGTRGQVRFRGKNSPKFRRQVADAARLEELRRVKAQADVAKRLLEQERGKTLAQVVKEKVKGFTGRLFRRGVR